MLGAREHVQHARAAQAVAEGAEAPDVTRQRGGIARDIDNVRHTPVGECLGDVGLESLARRISHDNAARQVEFVEAVAGGLLDAGALEGGRQV